MGETWTSYVDVVTYAIKQVNARNIRLKEVEKVENSKNVFLNMVKENMLVDKTNINSLVRLILREQIWAKMEEDCNRGIYNGVLYGVV